jgi:hypothetical protein
MDKVRNRYCVWSQIRDEARNLQRFIEWHLSQGFEYFVFGDDRSIDNPRSILEPYIDLGIVDIYDATGHSENHGRFVGKSFFAKDDIVAFIDVDEFVRSVSGFATNELDEIFSDCSIEILYLNWVFKSTGTTAPSLLGDYRDSFAYTQPDIFTKYIVRSCSIQKLKESELSCHFAPGIPIEKSINGASSQPQFIKPNEPGDVRECVRNNQFTLSKEPLTWSLYPQDPKIRLDHFYTREFDNYFNFKSILGNKQGVGTANEIRGMGYYNHGLGRADIATERTFNSLNFRRLFPKLELPEQREISNNRPNGNGKTVYIHMGLPKTGTTAFQDAILLYTKRNVLSPIGYVQIKNSDFMEYSQNGLDLTRTASHSTLDRFQNVIKDYCIAINDSDRLVHLITSEEFALMDSSFFGLVKQSFSNAGIHSCGIVVIRPFIEFALSFFKQYISMHVQMEYHTVLTYEQIAESARQHIERAVINCMLTSDFKVINYRKQSISNSIINFIYQESEPIDVSIIEQKTNIGLNLQTADALFLLRSVESVNNEYISKKYFQEHAADSPINYQLPSTHPYYIAIIRERERLKQFLSAFPHQHRWEHLFADGN